MLSIRNISSKVAAISLIIVVGVYSLNSVLYTHQHKLADGTIIAHAHPFDRSSDTDPFKSHHHSNVELVFLANLIHFLPAFIFVGLRAVPAVEPRLTSSYTYLHNQVAKWVCPKRGPPAFA